MMRATKWLVAVAACGFVALIVLLAYLRLAYPYEVEWMEGAMMDHSMRILDGLPLYSAPTIDFVPWLYPPLYYYIVAGAMKIVGVGFFAGRVVSFGSTLVTAGLLGWIVSRITQRPALALLTFALYLATYHATGFYFDIARNDAFFTLLLVGSAAVAIKLDGLAGASLSGLLLALAFLTKQQAIFFFPALAVWFWIQSKKQSAVFAVIAVGLTVLVLWMWNHASDGWLFYYLFHIPSAKTSDLSWLRAIEVLPTYVFGTFAVSSLAAIGLMIRLYKTQESYESRWTSSTGLLCLMSIAGLIAGAMSLGNDGGYANVMMPFAAFAVPMLPITVEEVQSHWPTMERYAWLAVLFQLAAFYFNPSSEKMLIASPHQRAGGDAFMQKLRAMPGDVYIPYHGFITRLAGKPSHANILATIDVLRTHDSTAVRLQRDLDSAFACHRFSAIIMEECPRIPCDSIAHYMLDGRMLLEPNVMLSRFGSEASRPNYVYIPK